MTTTFGTWGPAMLAFTAFLVAAFELSRRWLKPFIVLQVLLLGVALFGTPDAARSSFQTAKLVSAVIPGLFCSLVRLAYQEDGPAALRPLRRPWVFVLAFVTMLLNFLEAIMADLQVGQYLNALAGLILAATLVTPFGTGAWRIETETPKRDFLVALPRAWILIWTTWNLAFVYAQYPRYLAHVSCVVLAPLLYAVVVNRPDLWMAARLYTMGISVVIRWATHDFVTPLMDTTALGDPEVARGWGLVNLLMGVGYLVHRTARRRRVVPQAA